jgi:hypothetical protein
VREKRSVYSVMKVDVKEAVFWKDSTVIHCALYQRFFCMIGAKVGLVTPIE